MKNALAGLAGFGYFAMLIVQLVAIWEGIASWWGWTGILHVVGVLLIGAFPGLGQITGVVGAHQCWGLSWVASILLFFWPIALFVIASLFTKSSQ